MPLFKNIYMSKLLFFLCNFLTICTFAQEGTYYDSPSSMNSGISNFDTINYQISVSIGQTNISTLTTNNNSSENYIVTEGYLQPYFYIPKIILTKGDTLFCQNSLNDVLEFSSNNNGQEYPLIWEIDGEIINEQSFLFTFPYDQQDHIIIAKSSFPTIQADTFIVNSNFTRCSVDLLVYELISPNNDGKNDFLYIQNIQKLINNEVYLFNRWGNVLFFEENYGNTYSPTNLNKGEYVYVVKDNDRNITYTGNLIIQK